MLASVLKFSKRLSGSKTRTRALPRVGYDYKSSATVSADYGGVIYTSRGGRGDSREYHQPSL